MGTRLSHARQALGQAQEHLAQLQAAAPDAVDVLGAQALLEASEAEVRRWAGLHSTYRHHLARVSLTVHPWHLVDSTPQTSHEVERQLHAEVTAIETLVATHGLPIKKKALDKVRRQLAGLSALVDLWWQEVWHDIQPQVALTPPWTHWVAALLLPLMYWQAQLSRTRCPQRKANLVEAWEMVQEAFETHPLTHQLAPEVVAAWKTWAADHAKAFQRASSAVEGRNGYLSQMHHNQRGLPKRRYKVWTVLHNFDCHAADGSTPASRLFRREFPDLFEAMLSKLPDLPRPRQCRQALAISA